MSCCGSPNGGFPTDKHIVIVGAGYGGTAVARGLMKYPDVQFTLINPRDVFHHNVAGCRAGITPGLAKDTLIPLEPAFGSHLKLGKVVDIRTAQNRVVLESGEEMAYDVLILATGTAGPFPFKLTDESSEEALKAYDLSTKRVEESEKIVVIGGGATGVEMAAELRSLYPTKDVTLIHSASDVMHTFDSDKFKEKTRNIVTGKGAKLILGEKVTNLKEVTDAGSGVIQTDKGNSVEADLVFNCTGLRTNTSAYLNSLGDVMEDNGQLRVNQFLQVEGHENIFAIGDCTDTKEDKLGYTSNLHAEHLLANLPAYFKESRMKPYPVGQRPVQILLAMGPDAGVGLTKGGHIMPNFLAVRFKAKNLFISDMWKLLKQKRPKS